MTPKISAAKGRRIKHWTRELLLIIAGGAVALAADAQWSARSDRETESKSLNTLLTQTEKLIADLRADSTEVANYRARSAQLHRVLRGELPVPRGDSLSQLLTLGTITIRIPASPYSAMLELGRFDVVRDSELRFALVEFTNELIHARARGESFGEQHGLLNDTKVTALERAWTGAPTVGASNPPAGFGSGRATYNIDFEQLRRDAEFRSAVARTVDYAYATERRSGAILTMAARITSLLRRHPR
jgi:hypothetical protein